MKKEEYELAYGAEWDKDDVDVKDTYTDESGKNTIGYPGITMPVITIDKPKIIQDYRFGFIAVSYTHLRAHETVLDLVCRLLLEKKKTQLNT